MMYGQGANGERVAYFNGAIVPEREVKLPLHDRGFKYGDAVFDMTRSFGHRIFKLEERVRRLRELTRKTPECCGKQPGRICQNNLRPLVPINLVLRSPSRINKKLAALPNRQTDRAAESVVYS